MSDTDLVGDWTMRRGDRLPLLALILEDDEGRPLDLTQGRVWLMLQCEDGRTPVSLPAPLPPLLLENGWLLLEMMVYDAVNGIVVYDWPDLASTGLTVGVDQMMLRVDYLNGDHVTVPTNRDTRLVVRPPLTPLSDPSAAPAPANRIFLTF